MVVDCVLVVAMVLSVFGCGSVADFRVGVVVGMSSVRVLGYCYDL